MARSRNRHPEGVRLEERRLRYGDDYLTATML